MSELHLSSVEEASPRLAKWWSGVTSLRQEWQVSALSSRWPSLTTHHRRLSLAPLPAPSPSPHEALPRTNAPPPLFPFPPPSLPAPPSSGAPQEPAVGRLLSVCIPRGTVWQQGQDAKPALEQLQLAHTAEGGRRSKVSQRMHMRRGWNRVREG